MYCEQKHYYSEALKKDMYYKQYGQSGKICLIFPSQDGQHQDFESFGMIEVVRPWIEAGLVQFFAVDSVDKESWSAKDKPLHARGTRQEEYVKHVTEELFPLIRKQSGLYFQKFMGTGCSMGGTHAALALLRRPDLFDTAIALSPCLDARVLLEGQMNDIFYDNSPVDFLAGMPWNHPYLDMYRRSKLVVAIGQGRWEEDLLPGVRRTEQLLQEKQVPAFFDYWGQDVDHDWPWWRKMLPYHLGLLFPLAEN